MSIETIQNKHRIANILLVEDNQGDVILTRLAFQEAKIASQLHVAMNGEDAVAMLRKEGDWANLQTPDLILLDLNLPQMSGQDVLQTIKESQDLKHIPVLILSSSKAQQDVISSYDLHANGYLVKPASRNSFKDVIDKLEQFWFTVVILPDAEDVLDLQIP